MSDFNLDDLRDELDVFAEPKKTQGRSAVEERVIAGFEEIQRFVEKHGHPPQHGEDMDIFERLYAVRLDRLREQDELRALLAPQDHQGLLAASAEPSGGDGDTDLDELRAELEGAIGTSNITELKHVRSAVEKRAAEEIANRAVCENFDEYKPLFERVKRELKDGVRQTLPFQNLDEIRLAEIQDNQFFIVQGQIAYIAEVGEEFQTQYDRRDSRLRVIYDNGTESDLLLRSFQRALHRDETARIITTTDNGPLFASQEPSGDELASGTIYVLRSKSEQPEIAGHRDVLHKIGVTGGKVEARFANAKLDPTFLMADVEVVATYSLYQINRVKLENLIHRVFDSAQLDLELKDRFGTPVRPREWFLVPLYAIDEAVERIKDGSITGYVYDPVVAQLVKAGA
ncbi:MAG: GIY-YIG nuclease family protein [Terracidiphilus sp.]